MKDYKEITTSVEQVDTLLWDLLIHAEDHFKYDHETSMLVVHLTKHQLEHCNGGLEGSPATCDGFKKFVTSKHPDGTTWPHVEVAIRSLKMHCVPYDGIDRRVSLNVYGTLVECQYLPDGEFDYISIEVPVVNLSLMPADMLKESIELRLCLHTYKAYDRVDKIPLAELVKKDALAFLRDGAVSDDLKEVRESMKTVNLTT